MAQRKAEVIPIDSAPSYEKDIRCSNYLRSFIDPEEAKVQIDLCIRALKPHINEFDAIAFTGMSGALIAPPVALALGKTFIMVCKPETSTHSGYEVEGDYGAKRYIILDDFRCSGATEHRIVKAIERDIPNAEYKGFLMGGSNDLSLESVEYAERSGTPIRLLPKEDYE